MPEAPTAASILALVVSIEAHPAGSPAAVAYRLALTRKDREADAAGGPAAIDALLREVALSDPVRADARTAIIRAAWARTFPAGSRDCPHAPAQIRTGPQRSVAPHASAEAARPPSAPSPAWLPTPSRSRPVCKSLIKPCGLTVEEGMRHKLLP